MIKFAQIKDLAPTGNADLDKRRAAAIAERGRLLTPEEGLALGAGQPLPEDPYTPPTDTRPYEPSPFSPEETFKAAQEDGPS